ncbi:MAG TPA: hypothetical protein VHT30_11670 [Acidimicrobiales bacterium]|jgi:hypothetical protein|nr:hypothetical protein [Acidimicrobiales bacterium]
MAKQLDIVRDIMGDEFIERGIFRESLWLARSEQLLAELDAVYSRQRTIPADPDKLRLHMYDTGEWHGYPEFLGMPHWREAGPANCELSAGLMYAHQVQVVDPLPWPLAHARDGVKYVAPALIAAIDFWSHYEPLVDAGVLIVQRPHWFTDQLAKAPGSLLPSLLPSDFGLPDEEFTRNDQNEELWLDIERSLYQTNGQDVDIWFPTARHREIFCRLGVTVDLQVRDTQTALLSLTVPLLGQVDPKTLIDLRLNEAVFDEWRLDLRTAVTELRSLCLAPESEQWLVLSELRRSVERVARSFDHGALRSFADATLVPLGIGLLGAATTIPLLTTRDTVAAAVAVVASSTAKGVLAVRSSRGSRQQIEGFQRLGVLIGKRLARA